MGSRLAFVGAVVLGLVIAPMGGQSASASGDTLSSVGRTRVCSVHSLRGGYGFKGEGSAAGIGAIINVGRIRFDGAGGFAVTDVLNLNGFVLPREIAGGSYTVNADCTGTATFYAPPPVNLEIHLNLVLVGNGREAFFIQTDPGIIFSGVATQQ